MDKLIDEHLERMAELGRADRRNGCYRRWLLTELGDLVADNSRFSLAFSRPDASHPRHRRQSNRHCPVRAMSAGIAQACLNVLRTVSAARPPPDR